MIQKVKVMVDEVEVGKVSPITWVQTASKYIRKIPLSEAYPRHTPTPQPHVDQPIT